MVNNGFIPDNKAPFVGRLLDPNMDEQQYVPDRFKIAMYLSDKGFSWDLFYKVEVVGWYGMGQLS